MWNKIKTYAIAHLLGFILITVGWYMAIIDSALDRFSEKSVFSGTTIAALIIILIGAYLPEVWISIVKRKNQNN